MTEQLWNFVGIEGGGALRPDLVRRLGEALGVAPGQDDAGALGTGAPGSLQADPGTAPDDDNGLAEQVRIAADGCGLRAHDASDIYGDRPGRPRRNNQHSIAPEAGRC